MNQKHSGQTGGFIQEFFSRAMLSSEQDQTIFRSLCPPFVTVNTCVHPVRDSPKHFVH